MKIIDAQIHLWGAGLPDNQAHRQVTAFTAAEAIAMMDRDGIDAAIIHPPSWDPNATALATAAVQDYPGRFAIMGSLPLENPRAAAQIAGWRQHTGMLGLRFLLLKEPYRSWARDGRLDWLWAAAEASNVPIALLATDSFADLAGIAARFPDLKLTIDHLGGRGGNTTLKDDAAMAHIPALLALAKYPNIAVKATGLPGYSAEPYPFITMQGYLRQIFDAFGPERVFWGTDITKMPLSWRACATLFTEEIPWLNANDRRLIMGEAILAWWGWQRDTG